MVIQVGINGFGRIGRVIFRTCCQHPDIEVAAINDPAIDLAYICYLIKFDSTHGKYNGVISHEGDEIKINGHSIKVFHHKAPSDIPWQNAGVQYVIEASGMFTNLEKASGHLASEGVRRVLVTAPSSDVPMLVLGVNQERINPDVKVISCTSSTLYCLAPIIKLLQEEFGVAEGFVTSIHAMTPSLKPLDGLCIRGKHWRDHRSIHQNIIPAATGACKALGKIVPGVRDKLAGLAFRVPIVNVSVLDLSIRLNKDTTIKEITQCIEKYKDSAMKGIIQMSKEQAVSSDFIGDRHSCTLDVDSSLQLRPNFFKLICWYENEYSYACRVVDTILYSERQYSLGFTPLTKMTYVRPIFWKARSEQADISKKHVAVECVSIPKVSLNTCEAEPVSRPNQRPLSPYVSEESQINKRKVPSDEADAIKACIDKLSRSSSVRNKINFHENSIALKHIYQEERVKAEERLESVKKEFSRMVNITEDLLKKTSGNKLATALANRSPSKEITEKNISSGPTNRSQQINANQDPKAHSPEVAKRSPSNVINEKEKSNVLSTGLTLTIRNPKKGSSEKENSNTHSPDMAMPMRIPSIRITAKENLSAHSFRSAIRSTFKGTAEKVNANNTHNMSGIKVNNASKGITDKENLNAGLAVKSSKEISQTGNSTTHLSTTPMRRPSKDITEKQNSNICVPGVIPIAKHSAKEINESLNTNVAAMANSSSSKETAVIRTKVNVNEDLRKRTTDSFKNSNLNVEISREIRSFNLSDISKCAGETDSLNKSIDNNSTNPLPKQDFPIGKKTENVLQNIVYQTCENNSMAFKHKNTVKIINNISWDKLQQPNLKKNKSQVSNMANKLEENLNGHVSSSSFDNNYNFDEKRSTEEVMIHIVSENPKCVIAPSKLKEVESNVRESKQISDDATLQKAKAEDHEEIKLITPDLLNRALSKIEIVDEKLKERNIVLVEYGVESSKSESNTNEKIYKVAAGDFHGDSLKEIPRGQQSSSHDLVNVTSELTSMCVSPVNTVTTVSNGDMYRSKQDIYDKLDSASVSGSENSFQMLEKKSQIINITDLTYSLDDLARLDKICRIIEISDELSDKLFAPLNDRSGGETSQQKWSFKDLCQKINLDEFCNKVFGKTAL